MPCDRLLDWLVDRRVIKRAWQPAFQAVRGKTVVSLYNQPAVWEKFGYEGPSYPHGGYILNGFDDLSWLPDPPAEASPPAFD